MIGKSSSFIIVNDKKITLNMSYDELKKEMENRDSKLLVAKVSWDYSGCKRRFLKEQISNYGKIESPYDELKQK